MQKNRFFEEYEFKALTDIWTGSVEFIEKKESPATHQIVGTRLVTTGLLGAVRWWFEVLVRGMGGGACDPTGTKCRGKNRCVVCELFGCTDWARKFRFDVLDGDRQIQGKQIIEGKSFVLRFTKLRPISDAEWALLDATLRLIAEYGAMGGKTVLKPSDEKPRHKEKHRKEKRHKDYGLVEIAKAGAKENLFSRKILEDYAQNPKWQAVNHQDFSWASLLKFWCVNKKYLARTNAENSSFNRIIGRPEPKRNSKRGDSWTAGRRPDKQKGIDAESKKVFSFRQPARTFGFVRTAPEGFGPMKARLEAVWGKDGWDFMKGEQIIERLFTAGKEGK